MISTFFSIKNLNQGTFRPHHIIRPKATHLIPPNRLGSSKKRPRLVGKLPLLYRFIYVYMYIYMANIYIYIYGHIYILYYIYMIIYVTCVCLWWISQSRDFPGCQVKLRSHPALDSTINLGSRSRLEMVRAVVISLTGSLNIQNLLWIWFQHTLQESNMEMENPPFIVDSLFSS